jgi:hypothetical protein
MSENLLDYYLSLSTLRAFEVKIWTISNYGSTDVKLVDSLDDKLTQMTTEVLLEKVSLEISSARLLLKVRKSQKQN